MRIRSLLLSGSILALASGGCSSSSGPASSDAGGVGSETDAAPSTDAATLGDASVGVDGSPPADGAAPDGAAAADASASADGSSFPASCTYTLSGATTGTGGCTVTAQFDGSTLTVLVMTTGTFPQPLLGAELGTTSTFSTGVTTDATAVWSAGQYDILAQAPNAEWALCHRPGNPCSDGMSNPFNDVGTFTLTIASTGSAPLMVPGDDGAEIVEWMQPHGSLAMTLVADPETGTTGTVAVAATF